MRKSLKTKTRVSRHEYQTKNPFARLEANTSYSRMINFPSMFQKHPNATEEVVRDFRQLGIIAKLEEITSADPVSLLHPQTTLHTDAVIKKEDNNFYLTLEGFAVVLYFYAKKLPHAIMEVDLQNAILPAFNFLINAMTTRSSPSLTYDTVYSGNKTFNHLRLRLISDSGLRPTLNRIALKPKIEARRYTGDLRNKRMKQAIDLQNMHEHLIKLAERPLLPKNFHKPNKLANAFKSLRRVISSSLRLGSSEAASIEAEIADLQPPTKKRHSILGSIEISERAPEESHRSYPPYLALPLRDQIRILSTDVVAPTASKSAACPSPYATIKIEGDKQSTAAHSGDPGSQEGFGEEDPRKPSKLHVKDPLIISLPDTYNDSAADDPDDLRGEEVVRARPSRRR